MRPFRAGRHIVVWVRNSVNAVHLGATLGLDLYAFPLPPEPAVRPGVARWLCAPSSVLAGALSVGIGALLAAKIEFRALLLLLALFLLLRMAMNAIDGMLAREFGQKSDLGAYLNELTDVVSDAFLYLPFAYLPFFDPLWIGADIFLAASSEMAGAVAVMIGASRLWARATGLSLSERWRCGSVSAATWSPGLHGCSPV